MDDKEYAQFILGMSLKYSLRESTYLTTEEIARLIVEKRGPEDASAIAHWINEYEKDEAKGN